MGRSIGIKRFVAASTAASSHGLHRRDDRDAGDRAVPGFALVELFTSEGCSSCPPADELASRLIAFAREEHAPVYVLAHHVDYWDRLGWQDRFSSHLATRRQRRYAAVLGERSVYTPQMVVNGTVGFVGSNADRTAGEINAALATPTTCRVTASASWGEPFEGGRVIEMTADASTGFAADRVRSLRLITAIVESGLSSSVERGENAGRELTHGGVVRVFSETPWLGEPATVALPLGADVNAGRAQAIAFVQDARTMEILAAASTPLPA